MLAFEAKLWQAADALRNNTDAAEYKHVVLGLIFLEYHAWRGDKDAGAYADVPGFCMAATLEEVRQHGHVLTPERYVGAADIEDDPVPFAVRFAALAAELEQQFQESDRLQGVIRRNLLKLTPLRETAK